MSMLNQTMTTVLLLTVSGVSGVSGVSAAAPAGAVIRASALTGHQRVSLQRQIKQARVGQARAFKVLTAIHARLPDLALRQRGRLVNVLLPLRALGAQALFPMLDEIAFSSRGRGGLSDRAWLGWQASLLEALGSLRDPRASPVFEAALSDEGQAPAVLRAAARGLGRLCSDRTSATLIRLSRSPGDRQRHAALIGLGECRRLGSVQALVELLLKQELTESDRRSVVSSLGQVAGLWAWRAVGESRKEESRAVRLLAAKALIAVYPDLSSACKEKAAKALMIISHPDTQSRVASARAAATALRARDLDQLGRRIRRDSLLR